jgi:hypothetical protein
MDGPQFSAGNQGLTKEEDSGMVGSIIVGAGSQRSLVTDEAWTGIEDSGTEDLDDANDISAVRDKSLSLDIKSWYQNVINSEPETPSLVPTPFERGVIASLSVNDILMIRGLIHPLVYVQFINLSTLTSFHHDSTSRISREVLPSFDLNQ